MLTLTPCPSPKWRRGAKVFLRFVRKHTNKRAARSWSTFHEQKMQILRYEILIAQFDENTEETESKRKNHLAQE